MRHLEDWLVALLLTGFAVFGWAVLWSIMFA
jgi:hypothetical protein